MTKKMTSAIVTITVAFVASTVLGQDQQVSRLVDALQGSEPQAQLDAATALGQLGAQAKAAVPALARTLESNDQRLRLASVLALSEIGVEAKAALPALTARLQDRDPAVRAHTAFALGQIGDASKPTVAALIAAAVDEDATVRREVRDALRAIRAPAEMTLPLWIKTLEDSDPQVVLPALHTLAEEGKAAVPALRGALQHPKACYWACLVATEIGPDAHELTPELVGVLKHENPECRMQAMISLGEIGPGAKAAVPEIIEHLENEDFDSVRYAAAFALGRIDKSPAAQDALRKLFQSQDTGLRVISAWSLLTIDPNNTDDELRKAIVAGLRSEDSQIRHISLRALRELKPSETGVSDEVLEAFVAALRDSSPEVVAEVVDALASKGAQSVPNVIRGLGNPELRPLAVQVVMRMGPAAQGAVPALTEALQNAGQDPELRREIQFALGAIGEGAAAAVPALVESLSADEPDEVRYSACYALGKIGPAARSSVPAFHPLLRSDDEFMKLASVWALLRILPDNMEVKEHAVPLLTKALTDDRAHIREEAARTLGDIGELAKPSIPQLKKAAEDESPLVREAAAEALKKIER